MAQQIDKLKYAARRSLEWMQGAEMEEQIGDWIDPVLIDMLSHALDESIDTPLDRLIDNSVVDKK